MAYDLGQLTYMAGASGFSDPAAAAAHYQQHGYWPNKQYSGAPPPAAAQQPANGGGTGITDPQNRAPTAAELQQIQQSIAAIAQSEGVDYDSAVKIFTGAMARPSDGAYITQNTTGLAALIKDKPGLDWKTLEEVTRGAQAREQQARDELAFSKGNAIGQVDGTNTLEATKYANEIMSNPQNAALAEMMNSGYALGAQPSETVADFLNRSMKGPNAGQPGSGTTPPPAGTPTPPPTMNIGPSTSIPGSTSRSGSEAPFAQLRRQIDAARPTGGAIGVDSETGQLSAAAIAAGGESLNRNANSRQPGFFKGGKWSAPVMSRGKAARQGPPPPVAPAPLGPAFYGFKDADSAKDFQRVMAPHVRSWANESVGQGTLPEPEGEDPWGRFGAMLRGQRHAIDEGTRIQDILRRDPNSVRLGEPSLQSFYAHMGGDPNTDLDTIKQELLTMDFDPNTRMRQDEAGNVGEYNGLRETLLARSPEWMESFAFPGSYREGMSGVPKGFEAPSDIKHREAEEKSRSKSEFKTKAKAAPAARQKAADTAAAAVTPASRRALALSQLQLLQSLPEEQKARNQVTIMQLQAYLSGRHNVSTGYGGHSMDVSEEQHFQRLFPSAKSPMYGGRVAGGPVETNGAIIGGEPHFIVNSKGVPKAALTEDSKPEAVVGEQGGVEVIPLDPTRRAAYEMRKSRSGQPNSTAGLGNLPMLALGGKWGANSRTAPSRRPGSSAGNSNKNQSGTRSMLPDGSTAKRTPPVGDARAVNGQNQGRPQNPYSVRKQSQGRNPTDKDALSIRPPVNSVQKKVVQRMDNPVPAPKITSGAEYAKPIFAAPRLPAIGDEQMPTPVAPNTTGMPTPMPPEASDRTAIRDAAGNAVGQLPGAYGTPGSQFADLLKFAQSYQPKPQWTAPNTTPTTSTPITKMPGVVGQMPIPGQDQPLLTPVPPAAPGFMHGGRPLRGFAWGGFQGTGQDIDTTGWQDAWAQRNTGLYGDNTAGRWSWLAQGRPTIPLAPRPMVTPQPNVNAPNMSTPAPQASPGGGQGVFVGSGGPRTIGNNVVGARFGFDSNAPSAIAGQNARMAIPGNPGVGVMAAHKITPETMRKMTPAQQKMFASQVAASGQDTETYFKQAAYAEPGSTNTGRSFI